MRQAPSQARGQEEDEMTMQEWHNEHPDPAGLYPIVEDGEVVGTLDAREGGSDEYNIVDDEYAVRK